MFQPPRVSIGFRRLFVNTIVNTFPPGAYLSGDPRACILIATQPAAWGLGLAWGRLGDDRREGP